MEQKEVKCPMCGSLLEQHCLYDKCYQCNNTRCEVYGRRIDQWLLGILDYANTWANNSFELLLSNDKTWGYIFQVRDILKKAVGKRDVALIRDVQKALEFLNDKIEKANKHGKNN